MEIFPGLTMRDVQLFCNIPPLQGAGLVDAERLNKAARRYYRSIRRIGGPWVAGFDIGLSSEVSATYLLEWFHNRLGFGFQDRVGGAIMFAGLVWQVEMEFDGVKERRDYGLIFNAIKSLYIDADGNNQVTSWYTNDASIAEYGRRELIIPLDGVSATVAQTKCQSELTKTAYPAAEAIAIGSKNTADSVTVTATGLAFTANNRYVTAGDGSEVDVSAYVQNIVEADCDFLRAGYIQENTLQVVSGFNQPMRAWDALVELAELGDGTRPFVIYVDGNGYVNYHQADNAPKYEWRGRVGGGLRNRLGAHSPWQMQPGVVRNLTRPSSAPPPGSFLADGRDIWIAEIEMRDDADAPTMKPDGFDPAAIAAAVEQNKRWLEEAAANGEAVVNL